MFTGPIFLSDVVAQVESGRRVEAVRFEKGDYLGFGCRQDVLRKIIARNPSCSPETAGMIYWTSWGLFQLMGFNLYGSFIDFSNPLLEFWRDPEQQLTVFRKFISDAAYQDTDASTWQPSQWAAFARFYNGPGNVADYTNRLRVAYDDLSKQQQQEKTS